jgi:hypothetical protein
MRRRLVLWGSDADDNKILVGLELLDKENKVKLYIIPEEQATELFYTQMMNMWRDGDEILFPDEAKEIERDLSVVDDLLPEDIKVDRTDIVMRAKAEWHFVVLSAKLYEIYKSEIEDLKETVGNLTDYDGKIWEELKGFWGKVQSQVKEKNMFREHAESLKNKTNEAFEQLKGLRKEFEQKLKEESKEKADIFRAELKEIEEKIEKGLGLKPLFEELRDIQSRFKQERFDRKDQNSLWGKIDGLFKVIKEKKYGSKSKSGNSQFERLERRYNGLLSAIKKMQRSMDRDEDEMDFQKRRIDKTDGQLEMQLRQAKIKMIQERVSSKQIKLDDMLKTKLELEAKIEVEKKKEASRQHKAEVKKAAEKVKEKIADDIAESKADLDPETAEKLEKAAVEIAEAKQTKSKKEEEKPLVVVSSGSDQESEVKEEEQESIIDSIKETISESVEDLVTNVKAVAEVVEDKVEDFIEEFNKEEEKPPVVESTDTEQEPVEKKKEQESIIDSIKETISESVEDLVTNVKAVAEVVEDKVEDFIEELKKDEEE